VPAVEIADLTLPPAAEGTAEVALRVANARNIQNKRYADFGVADAVRSNSDVDGALLAEVASPDEAGRDLLTSAAEAMRLSARGHNRVLRVARTLADLEGGSKISRLHIAEALSYRRLGLQQR